MHKKLIRFDWALKKLLRHKANFGILEGFLSELLRFDVTIEAILESEGNQQTENDKYNRVDILVRTDDKELMLIEVQNDSEVDYFHRMVYGVSNLVSEYIKEGERYGTIKKIYSINIVYFGLGQGKDYVYEYRGEFIGLHYNDVLRPTNNQQITYNVEKVSDIFPKYFILKINNFNDVATDTLDQWIYFLKNSEVPLFHSAKGLKEVEEKMRYEHLSDYEKAGYKRFQENRRLEASITYTAIMEATDKAMIEVAKKSILQGLDNQIIATITGLPIDTIQLLREP